MAEKVVSLIEEMRERREQEIITDEDCQKLTRDYVIKYQLVEIPRGYRFGDEFHEAYRELTLYARLQGKFVLDLNDEEMTQFITFEAVKEMRDSYEKVRTLTYQNYHGTVEYSKEDDCFFGKVKDIKSLLSYEGYSVDELEVDFHRVIDEYLADCEELGVTQERPKDNKV